MNANTANQIALGSIGPILGPLYARQEGGITLVTLFKMTQNEAIAYVNDAFNVFLHVAHSLLHLSKAVRNSTYADMDNVVTTKPVIL